MSLEGLRNEIDQIDQELLERFTKRMEVSTRIALEKQAQGLPIWDPAREREKLEQVMKLVPKELEASACSLYDLLFELSRNHQRSQRLQKSDLYGEIRKVMEETPQLFPQAVSVACQGVEGAYSQQACQRLFKRPSIQHFKTFEGVFSAVESGFCDYAVLPLENSTAGSVTRIYDLMQSHQFHIVRSLRLKVDHNLLAPKGVALKDVKEVFSHEQALQQCAGFLEKLGPEVKITRIENTAAAAEAVANSGRKDVAAIASHSCIELYGLECLASGIQDRDNNYTRFICISKKLEIYPGADRSSIMMVLPHKPGALYKALSRFYALGINLNKLESRPLPNRDFEFMFYFDLETSVYAEEFAQLMDDLQSICERFTYLGSYTEVM